MSEKLYGKKVWFFPDGDLPQPGPKEPFGHEALMILNPNGADAEICIIVYYEDRDPDTVTGTSVSAHRVRCLRLDGPIGKENYKIPFGQYALKVEATVPVICQFGRLDVTQPNLAYYTTMGLGQ